MNMRIGILGGTFDPVHNGHLALAYAALEQLKLDRLVFVPACHHPLREKESATIASPESRLEMVRLAIKGEPNFEVADCEIKRRGVSYTVDTLREFRAKYPRPSELFFVTGGDWGKNLDQWKDIQIIFSLAHFIVAKRPGFDTRHLPRSVELLDFVPLDISSTQVREELRTKGFSSLVPKEVLNYVHDHKLYQT
ncbi:MAG: nicotinate-nucleotide adenylyltransferase [Candidatus Omnitrophica bacterium]|nr:nicotinate-nucleotide adenylyltransferase [Candidatus Omnitrophota bacterium]